jgi:hypothetical protein
VAAPLTTAKKFSLVYFGLAVLVGVAIGSFVMLVERPAPLPPPPWSTWQPTAADKVMRAQEIGQHVASQYHLPSGNKLVRVVVGAPVPTTTDPIKGVLIAQKVPATQSDVLSGVPATETMMYVLCGDGPKCAINEGTPSLARGAVLRREALELALYTFRYEKGINSVVAFSPPKKGDAMSLALFFDRKSYADQIERPLQTTLRPRPVAVNLTPSELKTVDTLTGRRVLHFALQRANGDRVLVLAPKLG